MGANGQRAIPVATVVRLPLYLRSLTMMRASGQLTVSSEALGELAAVGAAKVRKDLSYLGSHGIRGVGYDVEHLIFEISRELGLTTERPVVIAGAGNLGRALANYTGFGERGFPVIAVLDVARAKIGTRLAGLTVRPMADLDAVVADRAGCIGLIATPAPAAQAVADAFVASGVRSILNFAPVALSVPEDVTVRPVDLALELQILSFYAHRAAV